MTDTPPEETDRGAGRGTGTPEDAAVRSPVETDPVREALARPTRPVSSATRIVDTHIAKRRPVGARRE